MKTILVVFILILVIWQSIEVFYAQQKLDNITNGVAYLIFQNTFSIPSYTPIDNNKPTPILL
jgi:hypothetical protein